MLLASKLDLRASGCLHPQGMNIWTDIAYAFQTVLDIMPKRFALPKHSRDGQQCIQQHEALKT